MARAQQKTHDVKANTEKAKQTRNANSKKTPENSVRIDKIEQNTEKRYLQTSYNQWQIQEAAAY